LEILILNQIRKILANEKEVAKLLG